MMIKENDKMCVRIAPSFRDADADGMIGIRGYANYLQDMVTQHLYSYGKGNDVIPGEYGITWLYTRSAFRIYRRYRFCEEYLDLQTWAEKERMKAILHQALTVSRDGVLYAEGRLECCLYRIQEKELAMLRDIEYPFDVRREEFVSIRRFAKQVRDMEGFAPVYTHQVRYTDMDLNIHMNNIKYVDMFINAFDYAFYQKHMITALDMNYLQQCYENEQVQVWMKKEEDRYVLNAVKEDGQLAAQCMMTMKDIR